MASATDSIILQLQAQVAELQRVNSELIRQNAALRDQLEGKREILRQLLVKLKRVKLPTEAEQHHPDLFDYAKALLAHAGAELDDELADQDKPVADDEPEATEEEVEPGKAPTAPDAAKKKDRYGKKHPGRGKLPAHLPREITIHDLPEDERFDPVTGKPLRVRKYIDTERLEMRPDCLYVSVERRVVYDVPGLGLQTTDLPERPLPKIQAGHWFLAMLIVQRFIDHLPYERQAKRLKRYGVDWSPYVLNRWVLQLADKLDALYTCLRSDVLSCSHVGIDDTGIGLQVKGAGKLHNARMFVGRAAVGVGHVFFHFALTKEMANANEAFDALTEGTVQADRAANFNDIMAQEAITDAACWAHLIRKIKEAVTAHPHEANALLKITSELSVIEQSIADENDDQRLAVRQERSAPLVESFFKEARILNDDRVLLPKSPLRRAVSYALNDEQAFRVFISDPQLSMDNNAVERSLRGLGIGRNNWLFAANERGGHANAKFFSFMESCKAVGINPLVWMKDILDRIMTHPPDRLRELLPGYWKPLPENAQGGP